LYLPPPCHTSPGPPIAGRRFIFFSLFVPLQEISASFPVAVFWWYVVSPKAKGGLSLHFSGCGLTFFCFFFGSSMALPNNLSPQWHPPANLMHYRHVFPPFSRCVPHCVTCSPLVLSFSPQRWSFSFPPFSSDLTFLNGRASYRLMGFSRGVAFRRFYFFTGFPQGFPPARPPATSEETLPLFS